MLRVAQRRYMLRATPARQANMSPPQGASPSRNDASAASPGSVSEEGRNPGSEREQRHTLRATPMRLANTPPPHEASTRRNDASAASQESAREECQTPVSERSTFFIETGEMAKSSLPSPVPSTSSTAGSYALALRAPPSAGSSERAGVSTAPVVNPASTSITHGNRVPIFLREKSCWTQLSATFVAKRINITRATNSGKTVRVVPATISDFRAVVRVLNERKLEYHTYQLRQDKPRIIGVVIRGIPQGITDEVIAEELRDMGHDVHRVRRIRKGVHRTALDLVAVDVARGDGPNIYDIQRFMHLCVRVEARHRRQVTQCYRCQRYGHLASGCHLPARCVRCAGDHSLASCEHARDSPTCANCHGRHSAGSRDCPQRPGRSGRPRRLALEPTALDSEVTAPSAPPTVADPPTPRSDGQTVVVETGGAMRPATPTRTTSAVRPARPQRLSASTHLEPVASTSGGFSIALSRRQKKRRAKKPQPGGLQPEQVSRGNTAPVPPSAPDFRALECRLEKIEKMLASLAAAISEAAGRRSQHPAEDQLATLSQLLSQAVQVGATESAAELPEHNPDTTHYG